MSVLHTSLKICEYICSICSVMVEKMNDIPGIRRTKQLTSEQSRLQKSEVFMFVSRISSEENKILQQNENVLSKKNFLHSFSTYYFLTC